MNMKRIRDSSTNTGAIFCKTLLWGHSNFKIHSIPVYEGLYSILVNSADTD